VIRVVLAELPGLISDLVKRALLERPDIKVVREIGATCDPGEAVEAEDFDVVVTSIHGSAIPDRYQRLVFGPPHVAVVAISADGRRVEAYDRKVIREVGLEQLVDVIREVAQR
jgi:hypothetical protein